jgi:hypothetical protein
LKSPSSPARATSRVVKRYIDNEIWPAMRQHGFSRTEGRVAWRTHRDRIDIVEFVTFSSYETQRLRLKPGSFTIEMGCHLKYMVNPIAYPDDVAAMQAEPSIPACLFRGNLRRPYMKPIGLERHCWPVGVEGVPLERVLSGARQAVLEKGLQWFELLGKPAAVYELLTQRDENMLGLWGFGRPGSPLRVYMLAYAALAAGKMAAARRHMKQALNTGRFPGHASRMRADVGLAAPA